jgi:hypothetical protein
MLLVFEYKKTKKARSGTAGLAATSIKIEQQNVFFQKSTFLKKQIL